MRDIYIIVKDIDTTITVLSAAFDEDEAIIRADMKPIDFSEGSVDIIEKSTYGRIALMTLEADKYKDILKEEDIGSIYEISNTIEVTDYDGEVFEVVINRIMEKLSDSDDKTEWIEELGLNVNNDSDDMFDIDSMIINKS